MWQRGKRHIVQVYRKWKVAPAENANSSDSVEVAHKVETGGDAAFGTAASPKCINEKVLPSDDRDSHDNSQAGGSNFHHFPWSGDTSVRKRPRKVVGSHGCLVCFSVMCPVLLITAAVIIKTACNRLRDENELRVPATCSLTHVEEWVNQTTWCECGYCKGRNDHQWLCHSSYPCYVINVTYVTAHVTGPSLLVGVNSSTLCSIDLIKDCYIEPEMNRKLVEEELVVLQKTSPGVECVHDKENPWTTYLTKNYKVVNYTSVVKCYFWPAILIAISLCWMVAVGYDTISTVRARYTYSVWRNMQSPNFITPSVSEDSYSDGTHTPASWLGRLRNFLQDQIKERDETSARRAKLLNEMRLRGTMLTESGMTFYRPGHGNNSIVQTKTPSKIIEGILSKDAEGVIKRAQLDEPFVASDMTTDIGEKTMESKGCSQGNQNEMNTTDSGTLERRDSFFENRDVSSVTSLP